MTVLAKIRSRGGLLVTIIGVALLVFILQSALESGNVFLGNSDRNVGKIGGKAITYDEFNYKVQTAVETQKQNSKESTLDEASTDMIVQQTWSQMLNELVMNKEYAKLGINVSEDELYDLMMGNNPHAYIYQYFTDRQTGKVLSTFADPMGRLNVSKIIEYTQQMNEEQEASWVKLEGAIKEARIAEKYNNLIKFGLYTTTSEAKSAYLEKNKTFSVKYVVQKYNSLSDSSVSVKEEDIKNYYNTHQNDFKQETSRKLEYVVWDILPSETDMSEIKSDVNNLAEAFKTKTDEEDSSFVVNESDSRIFDMTYHKKGTLSPKLDTIMFNSPKGTVFGPYEEGNSYKVAKLIEARPMPDSVKARHILIKPINGDMARARAKADSIKKIINTKNFAEIAMKVSEDAGSAVKGGDLDWFTEGKMVQSFNDAAFKGKVGDMPIVESQFGVHLIEITGRGVESPRVRVAVIDKAIQPSPKTMQTIFAKASEFAGKNNTDALFNKAIEEQKLNKRVADNVKEEDKTIPGLETPKELIRWAYTAKQGEISSAFEIGKKFVVAHLSEVREKGIAPLELVKNEVEAKARQQKKAEKLIAQFTASMTGVVSMDDLGKKMNLPVLSMENLSFSSNALPGAGKEEKVIGVTTTLKSNAISKPIEGQSGVFVVRVEAVTEAPAIKEYTAMKMQSESTLQSRVGYEVFDALKENADVEDHRSKFY